MHQDVLAGEGGLEGSNRRAVLVREDPLCTRLAQLVERVGHRGVMRDVLGIEVGHAQKRRQLAHVRRVLQGGDGDGFFGVRAAAVFVDRVAEAGELGEAVEGFGGLEEEIALAAALEDLAAAVQVLHPAVGPHNYVVQVHQAEDPLEASEGGVHHALEDCWRIF